MPRPDLTSLALPLALALLAMVSGCAGGTSDEGESGTEGADALAGSTGGEEPPSRGGADGAVGSQPPSETPLPGEPCTPGADLGLCKRCSADGLPELPLDDVRCPAPDCSLLGDYERTMDADGVLLCRFLGRAPNAAAVRCLGPGQCAGASAQACGASAEPTEAARVDVACARVEGCFAQTPPQVTPLEAGRPCNGLGTCQDDGTCSLPGACTRYADQQFCLSEMIEGQIECELYVTTGDQTQTTCQAYCEAKGACCIDAWPNVNAGSCERGGRGGCRDEHNDLICRCAQLDECPDTGGFHP